MFNYQDKPVNLQKCFKVGKSRIFVNMSAIFFLEETFSKKNSPQAIQFSKKWILRRMCFILADYCFFTAIKNGALLSVLTPVASNLLFSFNHGSLFSISLNNLCIQLNCFKQSNIAMYSASPLKVATSIFFLVLQITDVSWMAIFGFPCSFFNRHHSEDE